LGVARRPGALGRAAVGGHSGSAQPRAPAQAPPGRGARRRGSEGPGAYWESQGKARGLLDFQAP